MNFLAVIPARSNSKSIKKNSAKLALSFVKNFKIVKFDYVSDVDTSILIYSQKYSVNVATCDKKLKKQSQLNRFHINTCYHDLLIIIKFTTILPREPM